MRTFIFGAGASVDAGYPCAKDLWHSIEQWAKATCSADPRFSQTVDLMNAEFDMSEPFELALTDLEDRIDQVLSKRRTTRAECEEKVRLVDILRPNITAMIPAYFRSLGAHHADCYRDFAGNVLARGDVVITFNYDLAIDRELKRSGKWSIGSGYGFPVSSIPFEAAACKLLKLHGSVNWVGQPFQGRLGLGQVDPDQRSLGKYPVIKPSDLKYLGYNNVVSSAFNPAAPEIPSLIMPMARKKFYTETSFGREWEDFWNSLWHDAGEALQASDEIYLIGYSIPEYDDRARALFSENASGSRQLEVCCCTSTDSVIESLRSLGCHAAKAACAATFEDWVSCMSANC